MGTIKSRAFRTLTITPVTATADQIIARCPNPPTSDDGGPNITVECGDVEYLIEVVFWLGGLYTAMLTEGTYGKKPFTIA